MSRLRSDRELLAELIACVESDGDREELQELLLGHGVRICALLGIEPDALEILNRLAPENRRTRVGQLVSAARAQAVAARATQLDNLARAAADMLAGLARFRDASVELDARIVLGTLLVGQAKFVRLDVEGFEPVTLSRSKLREANRALKGRELRCFVDTRGLHFVWATGALTLYRQQMGRHDQDRVLHVVVARPLPPPVPLPRSSMRERSVRAALLVGDVLTELGFFA